MFTIHKETFDWGGRELTLETGKIARQADGSVLATYGETVVLATVVGAANPKEGQDFFPLTVNYQERYYAAGKIPGGYFKRERGLTERETLISRLIDRPVRPLFADGYKNEVLIVAQVLSHDLENDPDVVAMVAVSAALTISGLPFQGPIAAARVGYINDEYVLNPSIDQYPESKLELVVAGTRDAVMMVESEAQELSEEVMLGAVMFGHAQMQTAIDAIIRLAEKAAKDPRAVPQDTNGPMREKIRAATTASSVRPKWTSDRCTRVFIRTPVARVRSPAAMPAAAGTARACPAPSLRRRWRRAAAGGGSSPRTPGPSACRNRGPGRAAGTAP